jgi:hypothetical protein
MYPAVPAIRRILSLYRFTTLRNLIPIATRAANLYSVNLRTVLSAAKLWRTGGSMIWTALIQFRCIFGAARSASKREFCRIRWSEPELRPTGNSRASRRNLRVLFRISTRIACDQAKQPVRKYHRGGNEVFRRLFGRDVLILNLDVVQINSL